MDLQEVINPKALGGILPIKIHQVIKLQLESSAASGGTLDSRYLYITDHHEVHTVQEYISRIPVVGSWYDGSIREAMGSKFESFFFTTAGTPYLSSFIPHFSTELMLTGSSLLDATGIMDYVPGVVSSALGVASSAATRVGEVAEGALAVTHRAADATG